jgi:hypothetical protein
VREAGRYALRLECGTLTGEAVTVRVSVAGRELRARVTQSGGAALGEMDLPAGAPELRLEVAVCEPEGKAELEGVMGLRFETAVAD